MSDSLLAVKGHRRDASERLLRNRDPCNSPKAREVGLQLLRESLLTEFANNDWEFGLRAAAPAALEPRELLYLLSKVAAAGVIGWGKRWTEMWCFVAEVKCNSG